MGKEKVSKNHRLAATSGTVQAGGTPMIDEPRVYQMAREYQMNLSLPGH